MSFLEWIKSIFKKPKPKPMTLRFPTLGSVLSFYSTNDNQTDYNYAIDAPTKALWVLAFNVARDDLLAHGVRTSWDFLETFKLSGRYWCARIAPFVDFCAAYHLRPRLLLDGIDAAVGAGWSLANIRSRTQEALDFYYARCVAKGIAPGDIEVQLWGEVDGSWLTVSANGTSPMTSGNTVFNGLDYHGMKVLSPPVLTFSPTTAYGAAIAEIAEQSSPWLTIITEWCFDPYVDNRSGSLWPITRFADLLTASVAAFRAVTGPWTGKPMNVAEWGLCTNYANTSDEATIGQLQADYQKEVESRGFRSAGVYAVMDNDPVTPTGANFGFTKNDGSVYTTRLAAFKTRILSGVVPNYFVRRR